jgi:glycine betaine/proline transport system substrate-binding protein
MNIDRKRTQQIAWGVLAAALVVMILIYAFSGSEKNGEAGGTVELVYVEWVSAVASTNVVKAVLEEKMGYSCDITPVSAAAMWRGVAAGDQDGMVAAWLPTTHRQYWDKMKDMVVDLGPNLEGTRVGLVVPEYVGVESIADLPQYADRLNARIVGIDPGAGIMSATEEALNVYNLDNWNLQQGTGASMVAALRSAVNNEEWVVVTGWTPHWMFFEWDLKYLDDPKNAYDKKGSIHTIVRSNLKRDMPEVYEFLDAFRWTVKDCEQVMAWNRQRGADPYQNALKWIRQNTDKVESWLPADAQGQSKANTQEEPEAVPGDAAREE